MGGFSEENKGTPEDLIFFYAHLNKGGSVHRVDEYLLIYTYHLGSATFSVSRFVKTIMIRGVPTKCQLTSIIKYYQYQYFMIIQRKVAKYCLLAD